MGFRMVKKRLLNCLVNEEILHEARGSIELKNLLLTGQINIVELIDIIAQARGNEYECRPHHSVANVDVHILKTRHARKSWYIKWYFLSPNCVFISVHN